MKNPLRLCYLMLLVSVALVAGTFKYLSWSPVTEPALRTDTNLVVLNGPWKFISGDNRRYSEPAYDDSEWEAMDLSAPPGVHDDDVGLSGYVPGWAAKGHPGYSGYAWYRLKIPLKAPPGNELALAAPTAVEDVYQLFINGVAVGGIGDFSGTIPAIYSIQPRMFVLRGKLIKGESVTIAFRVWMSPASRGADAGGIRVAPTLGPRQHIQKKYRFQWAQTIKGYIIEVVWPLLFVLLALTMFLLSGGSNPPRPYKWFAAALILLGLMRLNQAVYFWFHIESSDQAVIIGSVILRPLMLGSWLMAWREWFNLQKPKWLPALVALLTLLFMAAQLFSISWVSHAMHTHFITLADYLRLLLLALYLIVIYLGLRKQELKNLLTLAAALIMLIALFPGEISALNLIPGIWFPYGVGVSRGQFFYAAFVFVMYAVLIMREKVALSHRLG